MADTPSTVRFKLKGLSEDLITKELLTEIGEKIRNLVKTRTRKGKGVPVDGGPQKPLTKLSRKNGKKSYVSQRERMQARGKLSPETSPGKSNLTLTGDLLDTIEYDVLKTQVNIRPKAGNEKKVKHQPEGRTAFNLSTKEVKIVTNIVENQIINDIKKNGL